jgi:hypothetical protein
MICTESPTYTNWSINVPNDVLQHDMLQLVQLKNRSMGKIFGIH